MTTAPNSNAGLTDAPAAGESAHTDLVSKLVAEAFSGFARGPKPPANLPAAPAE